MGYIYFLIVLHMINFNKFYEFYFMIFFKILRKHVFISFYYLLNNLNTFICCNYDLEFLTIWWYDRRITLGMGLFYYGLRDTSATYSVNFLSLVPISTFIFSIICRYIYAYTKNIHYMYKHILTEYSCISFYSYELINTDMI